MQPIAHIHTDFPTKFGVPRQSGLVDRLTSAIVFEPEFRKNVCAQMQRMQADHGKSCQGH